MFNKRVIWGYGCILLGVIGGFLPIIQGWLFIILGLMLLRPHVAWASKLLNWIPRRYPKLQPIFSKAETKFDELLAKLASKPKN